ncbi:unnamed protein product, partial [marine sediment metagenome]
EAQLLEAMGAATVYFPGEEMYEALILGTIDVATYGEEAVRDMKLGEIMKYLIRPPFMDHHGGVLLVNIDTWHTLPDDIQDIVTEESVRYHYGNLEDYQKITLYNNTVGAEEWGYEIINWSSEEVEKMIAMILPAVWEPFSLQSPRCAEGIRLMEELK